MSLGTITMGRPKRGEHKTPEPSLKNDNRVAIIHIKGSTAYAEWLETAFQKTHIPKSSMFRLAMIDWAIKNGLEPPPEI